MEESKITVEEILFLSSELRKVDKQTLNKFIGENKSDLSRFREQFIKEFKNVPDNDKVKKLLIEDLKLLSIHI